MSDNGGLRYDTGKVRYDLIPPEWEHALAEVLTAGAAKYADRNWERGMSWAKMVGCARRHLWKWLRGEVYDAETGCHHLAHVAWNVLALMSYQLRRVGEDDLLAPELGPTQVPRAVAVRPTPGEALTQLLMGSGSSARDPEAARRHAAQIALQGPPPSGVLQLSPSLSIADEIAVGSNDAHDDGA